MALRMCFMGEDAGIGLVGIAIVTQPIGLIAATAVPRRDM
jgi:hypothetical protein